MLAKASLWLHNSQASEATEAAAEAIPGLGEGGDRP